MKKLILIIASLFLITLVYSACNSGDKKENTTEQTTNEEGSYECPMKCEGSKSDKPGKCPMCGMDLEKMQGHTNSDHHEHSDSTGHENHEH